MSLARVSRVGVPGRFIVWCVWTGGWSCAFLIDRYESLLSELGIDGLDPRSELMSLAAAQLPGIYGEVVAVLLRSGPAWLELYQAR